MKSSNPSWLLIFTYVRDRDEFRKAPFAHSFQCAQAMPRAYSRRNSMQPVPHKDSWGSYVRSDGVSGQGWSCFWAVRWCILLYYVALAQHHLVFHETCVGHGLREVAGQLFLVEKEVIVLEVAEWAKMVAQLDGHDFALGHLPFAVSHALISLVYGAIWRFLVNSASKFLQKSSNTQNVSVTLSAVIIAVYVCKLLIFQL